MAGGEAGTAIGLLGVGHCHGPVPERNFLVQQVFLVGCMDIMANAAIPSLFPVNMHKMQVLVAIAEGSCRRGALCSK